MRRLRLLLAGWLLLLAAASWPAQARAQDAGVSFQVTPVFGSTYRPGYWLPLRVLLTNDGTDRTLELRAGSFSTRLEVPGGGRKETILYVFLEQTARLRVTLRDGATELGTQVVDLNPTSKPLLGALRSRALPRLADYAVVAAQAPTMPTTSVGLDPLSALLVDEQGWRALTPQQIAAIEAWVAQGGTLIAEGGAANLLPDSLRPAAAGPAQPNDGAALATMVAAAERPAAFDAAQLTPVSGAQTLTPPGGAPLLVQLAFGGGKIIAAAMPLDAPGLLTWRGYDQLLSRLIPLPETVPWGGQIIPSTIRDSQVVSYLNNLPALDLPPLRLLLVLLGVYVLLAGPVNHFVLRRLDRMALGWVTIPALTIVFAVLAYGFGARQRGTDIIINELAVIEEHGAGQTLVRGFVGVFSPIKDEYRLTAAENTLLRPLSFSGGGFGGAPGVQANKAVYRNSPAEVDTLNVNQWSMAMFAYQRPLGRSLMPEATLTLRDNKLTGMVRNTTGAPLREVALLVGDLGLKLGAMAPGEEKQIALDLTVRGGFQQMAPSSVLYQAELDQAYRDNPSTGPGRDLMAKTMAIDTALMSGSGVYSAEPRLIAFLDQPLESLTMVDRRATHHQQAVLVTRPKLGYGDGQVALDGRWMKVVSSDADQVFSGPATCATGRGPGVGVESDRAELSIRLPAQLSALVPEEIRFEPGLDGIVDSGKLAYEVYDWQAAAWQPAAISNGVVKLPAAAPFLSAGEIRLRFTIPKQNELAGGWWGCFSPGVTVKGRLP